MDDSGARAGSGPQGARRAGRAVRPRGAVLAGALPCRAAWTRTAEWLSGCCLVLARGLVLSASLAWPAWAAPARVSLAGKACSLAGMLTGGAPLVGPSVLLQCHGRLLCAAEHNATGRMSSRGAWRGGGAPIAWSGLTCCAAEPLLAAASNYLDDRHHWTPCSKTHSLWGGGRPPPHLHHAPTHACRACASSASRCSCGARRWRSRASSMR